MKNSLLLPNLSIISAFTSSLCCILPVFAFLAGSSGVALVLGFAWYQKFKPQQKNDCNCDINQKPNFMQTKSFLGIITIMSVLLLSFPSFAHIFFPKTKSNTIITQISNIQKAEFTIKGMSCTGCEHHVKTEISKLKGIVEVVVSYEKGNAIVKFDNKQTNIEEITKAINSTGYKSLKSKIIS